MKIERTASDVKAADTILILHSQRICIYPLMSKKFGQIFFYFFLHLTNVSSANNRDNGGQITETLLCFSFFTTKDRLTNRGD